jgi:predicted MFS family arabinose efflux permease
MPTESTLPGHGAQPLAPKVLWVAGGLGIIATVLAAVLPLLVGVWQAQFAVPADRAGYVAATELFGQVLGTVAFVLAARKWSWRTCAVTGLMIMIVGNLASAASADVGSLIAARTIAGLGGGGVRALCMTCLARAVSPGLAFAIYAAAQVALAASVTALLPTIVRSLGPHVPFLLLSAVAAAGLLVTPLLPSLAPSGGKHRRLQPKGVPTSAFWAVGALFVYFLAQGALWTFLEPVGTYQSIPQPDIVRALALLNIAGLTGALGIGALAHRAKPLTTLLALLGVEVVSIIALFNTHAPLIFIASACGFYFAWCASFPFQFAIISRSDGTGTASAAVPAVDGFGLACGAALAGACIPTFGVLATGWICGVGSTLAIACYGVATASAQRPTRRSESSQSSANVI